MQADPKVMNLLIDLATENHRNGGHAVAAAIVRDGEILATGVTTIIKGNDPTAHAEINAIRSAAQKIAQRFLEGCYLYTTYEPCPMCASAAIWAKMQGIVFGARMSDQTEKCPQRVAVSVETMISHGSPRLEIIPSFMQAECAKLLRL